MTDQTLRGGYVVDVGSPGSPSVQKPSPSSRSAQSAQYPSQPSPNSENETPHSRQIAMQGTLFAVQSGVIPRDEAMQIITAHHYLGSFPSGWTYCYRHRGAVVVFSIPANKNLAPYLFGKDSTLDVRELARLWAPDGHEPNLLTSAVAAALSSLRADVGTEAVVSFADPNHGHHGGIYQAASWAYTGQSEETRVYRTPEGRTVSRRSFHSGKTSLPPSLPEVRLLGKHRYVKCLTRGARRQLRHIPAAYPKPRTRSAA